MPCGPLFISFLETKAFRYLLAKNASNIGLLHGISFPKNQGHLINGHFENGLFLIIGEDEYYLIEAILYLNFFCQAFNSSIE